MPAPDAPPDDDDDARDDERPVIDLTPALHTAGHETELLHAEGISDSAPAIGGVHLADDDFDLETAAAFGLRGMDADLANVNDDRPARPD